MIEPFRGLASQHSDGRGSAQMAAAVGFYTAASLGISGITINAGVTFSTDVIDVRGFNNFMLIGECTAQNLSLRFMHLIPDTVGTTVQRTVGNITAGTGPVILTFGAFSPSAATGSGDAFMLLRVDLVNTGGVNATAVTARLWAGTR